MGLDACHLPDQAIQSLHLQYQNTMGCRQDLCQPCNIYFCMMTGLLLKHRRVHAMQAGQQVC